MAIKQKSALALLCALSAAAICLAQQQETFTVQYRDGTREQVMQDVVRKGWTVLREYKRFNRLVISAASSSAVTTAAATASNHADAAAVSIAAVHHLTDSSDVAKIERNGFIRAPRPVPDYEAAAAAVDSARQCSAADPNNPDAGLGLDGEGVPYGIKLVQADTPEMKTIAAEHRDKVLFCVIDTGLDITNQEFDKERTSGCIGPGFSGNLTARDNFKYCYNWYEDQHGHGTHTSGTVAALRNGRGVVGVSPEGAHLYHYNFFGPHEQEAVDLTVATWLECIDELDRRKVSTGNPDMKMVISMSFGVDYPNEFAQTAIKTLAAERQDVLWLASAGNSGDDTMGCPACYPQIMSVAAVDWNNQVAGFSTRNSQVDIAAPGVKTVSTVPLANTAGSDYYFKGTKDILTTSPTIAAVQEEGDFFAKPPVGNIHGAPAGLVSGDLVDCGLAKAGKCPGANGKVCLIQRGETTFCSKIAACANSGGIGAILYNSADPPACERLTAVDLSTCTEAPAAWPVAITASRRQGEALKTALAVRNGTGLSVTLNVPAVAPQKEIGLDAYSGTSMACPTAAGVAGLVWSAHTACSSTEIRAALENTAKKQPGVSTWTPEYGHGTIQALAAHQYLLQHPCSGGRKVQLEISHEVVPGAKAGDRKHTLDKRPQAISSNSVQPAGTVQPTAGAHASVKDVDVKIVVKLEGAGTPVAGQAVRLAVRPGPDGTKLTCQKHVLTTDVHGSAVARCQLMQLAQGAGGSSGGAAVIVVKVPAAPGLESASKIHRIEA